MTISYVGTGGVAGGNTSLSVPYPASLAAGDILIMGITTKYPPNPPYVPAGWNFGMTRGGGSGASAADAGTVWVTVMWRESDGTETGNETVSIPSGNSALGQIFAYRSSAGFVPPTFDGGADNTVGTAWSVTGSTLRVYENDWIVAISGANTDAPTMSGTAIAASGVTFGTTIQRVQTRTTTGDDCMLWVNDAPLSNGAGNLTLSLTSTASTSGATYPAGATLFVCLSEILKGTLSKTLAGLTLSATATMQAITKATLSKTLSSLTLSAAGINLPTIVGSLSKTLAGLTLDADATYYPKLVASLSKTLAGLTLDATGINHPITIGSLSKTLAGMTLSAHGQNYKRSGVYVVPYRFSQAARRYNFVAMERETRTEVEP